MTELKESYLKRIKKNPYFLSKKNGFRIATYNVHYWCDVYERNTLPLILKDIKYINADIICLQEAIVGSIYKVENKKINTEHVIALLEELGYHIIFCNNVPTWFNSVYGNMMCVKKKLVSLLKNEAVSIHTFEKSKTQCLVSGNIKGIPETRCFIQLELPNYLILCTHLDVCDEQTRVEQISILLEVIRKSKKKVILVGDFNSTDIHESSQKEAIMKYVYQDDTKWIQQNTIQKIKRSGFKSVLTVPTTWSNIQTDYIFVKGIRSIEAQVLYTPHSDHLPLVIDIKTPKTKRVG
jgi:endonuclease/exonuclease/phosphatase family metal-dependent hydrolase